MKKFVAFLAFQSLFLAACTNQPVQPSSAKTAKREVVSVRSKRVPAATDAQKQIDDHCFVNYTRAASFCNESAGDNDVAFSRCLNPVKKELKRCCQLQGGSADCAADAAPLSEQTTTAIDDRCFVEYTRAAGRCNESAGDNEDVFGACLRPVKTELKACCREFGGSANCAVDAE